MVALDRGYLTFAGHAIGGAKRFDGRKEPWLIARRDFESACGAGFGKAWREAETPWSSLAAIVERLAQDDEAGARDLIKRFECGISEHRSREAIAQALKPFAKHADAHPALATQQQKFNPNHDERGRFASGSGGSAEGAIGDGLGHEIAQSGASAGGSPVSARDKAFLDKYYDPVAKLAENYQVNPAFVLGLAAESGFGTKGTYLQTKDVFCMTGGTTSNMTTASSPAENTEQLFSRYGTQIRGTGNDAAAFLNALDGKDPLGRPVAGWKRYNSEYTATWRTMVERGIVEMRRVVPRYLTNR
jgi:hypothetical protein